MKYSLFYLFLLPLGESDVVARQLMNRHRRSYRITVDYAGIRLWDRFFFFRCAANRWDKVITEEQPDVQEDLSKFPDTDCGPYPETIDDLYLCASYKSFGDGLGGVVATAMPTIYRDNSLPLAGFIRFDADDIQLLKQFKTFRGTIVSIVSDFVVGQIRREN